MLTFYQYLETITHDKFDQNDSSKSRYLISILSRLDHKTIVRFALFCVKDVQHLNNHPSISNVINLIEKWLKDNGSVSDQEMRAASDVAFDAAEVTHADAAAYDADAGHDYLALYAAAAAADTAVNAANSAAASADAANAADAAADARANATVYNSARANTSTHAAFLAAVDATYDAELDRYIQIAKSLTSKSNVKDQKIHIFIRELEQYINNPKEFKATLSVLFDYLDEIHQEQIIQSIGNKLRLNLPTGYDITSEDDLVQVIAGDNGLRSQVLFYLKNLYKLA